MIAPTRRMVSLPYVGAVIDRPRICHFRKVRYMNALYASGIKVSGAPEEGYLKDIPAVRWLLDGEQLSLSSPVTFFVGG